MLVEVGGALVGERLDRAVATVCGCSRADAAAAVSDGRVRVDGEVVLARSRRLGDGEELDVPEISGAPDPRPVPDASVPFTVVFEDGHLLVVDKPAGVVVHPGAGPAEPTLVAGLLARHRDLAEVGDPRRPGIVHRLDRGTSGLMVVARTADAHAALTEALAGRRVGRRYRALVQGRPEADVGLVDAPVGRSRRNRTRMAVAAGGREARTRYEVRARWRDPEVAMLDCHLETGRTHQIRVHVAAIGHAVVADTAYGATVTLGLARPFLHAEHLALDHPATGEALSFASELPPDLAAALDALGPPDG